MREALAPPTFAQFRDNYGSHVLNSVLRTPRGVRIRDDDRLAYSAAQAAYGDGPAHDALLGQGYNLDDDLSTENTRVYGKGGDGIVAYRGTTKTNEDYVADIAIATGFSESDESFNEAVRLAQRAKQKYNNVMYTGHSLGGAKAVHAARNNGGGKSIVFNPGTSVRGPLDTSGARVHRTRGDYISYNISGGDINTYDGGHSLNFFDAFMK